MPKYRRSRVSGGSYFFTVALAERRSDLLVREIGHLRAAFAEAQQARPFRCDAIVILPDHMHAIWTLPSDDNDYSTRWAHLKSSFSRRIGRKGRRSASKAAKREAGIWQRRFWERTLRDEADFAAHVAYCWGNPVKHGLVSRAIDWPYSSFHRDMQRGVVPVEWSAVQADGRFGEPSMR